MTMPAEVAAAFEVVQSQAVLEFPVVVLDPPPDLRQAHQGLDVGVRVEGGQPVVGGLVVAGWPFGQ